VVPVTRRLAGMAAGARFSRRRCRTFKTVRVQTVFGSKKKRKITNRRSDLGFAILYTVCHVRKYNIVLKLLLLC